jgi:hypothetical protein
MAAMPEPSTICSVRAERAFAKKFGNGAAGLRLRGELPAIIVRENSRLFTIAKIDIRIDLSKDASAVRLSFAQNGQELAFADLDFRSRYRHCDIGSGAGWDDGFGCIGARSKSSFARHQLSELVGI